MGDGLGAGVRGVRLSADVAFRTFGDETVLLNLTTGTYHGLNPTAGRMLELLIETGDEGETARRVAAEYEIPVEVVEADLAALCADLRARALLETVTGPAPK
jgi:hypothetical protein